MNQAIQLRTSQNLPDIADPFALDQRQGERASAVFRKIHRLLRNRYKWCVVLTLLGLGLGGFGGYRLAKQTYMSTGMIHIRPVLSPVLTKSFENEPVLMFDQFVQAQASLFRTQRVIDMAMGSDEWKTLRRPANDEAIADFMDNLIITAPRGEVITVSFKDENPKAAQVAVKAVMTAYDRIYVESEIQAEDKKRQALEERRITQANQLKSTQEAIRQIAKEFGTVELRSHYEFKLQTLNRLEAALSEVEFELAGLDAKRTSSATQPSETEMPIAEIAQRDAGMRQLHRELDNLKTDLSIRLRSFGESHAIVVNLRSLIAAKEQAITQYAADYRAAVKSATAHGFAPGTTGLSVDENKSRKEKYTEMVAQAKRDTVDIGRQMLEIDKLRKAEEQVNQQLEQTRARLDQLATESTPQGRIRLVSLGDRPMLTRDNRIIRALAGGILGGSLGFGIVLLIALLDGRFRTAEDARSSVGRLALLGVLPSLPDDLADPEQAAIAAHCVHQIRTLLQISSAGPGARVFVITSPAAGTGKTSLALALGVSFAATNSRTLLIDCDIIGGGLTARVDTIIRRKIGQILKREGLITSQQLDVAMKVAQNSQRRLGEILVDLGYLTEADVTRALSLQEEGHVGMLDALAGEMLQDCVAETGIRGLAILPLGAAIPSDAGRLSPAAVRRLIDEARKHYDNILIDTGPVPGSLEASMVAAEADGVVLVVSRGEHRPLAERSLQHLHDIGAVVAGMVFNRAEGRDADLSTTTNRLSTFDRAGRASVRPADVVVGAEPPKLGPIALAVAGRGPVSTKSSRP